MTAAEGDLERVTTLEGELAGVLEKLAELERTGLTDARRIAELETRLDALEAERVDNDRRLERIERALGID